MQLSIEDKFYGIVFTNTFPGLIFAGDILLAFELFTHLNIFNKMPKLENNIANLIAVIVVIFVVATLLGLIIDGIRHSLYNDLKYNGPKKKELITVIKSTGQLDVYRYFHTSYWYSYEATANMGLAMIPSVILLPLWFLRLGISIYFNIAVSILYLFIVIKIIQVSRQFLKKVNEVEEELIENFSNENERST